MGLRLQHLAWDAIISDTWRTLTLTSSSDRATLAVLDLACDAASSDRRTVNCACQCNAWSLAGSTCALISLKLWECNMYAVSANSANRAVRRVWCDSLVAMQPRQLKQRSRRRQK